MKRILLALTALLSLTAAPRLLPAQERGAAALGELVDGFGVSTRVLVIGAHPDDEDTRLIAWLARGRHVETAYLSLTRGDGGQNLIGNELGEALGVVRTEELLAARRVDGAVQYFTRAYDFGFSKSAEETYRHWPHDTLIGDVVRVVRAFKPHVIVAVFSGTPSDGHGHHQVSGLLAREAYDVAGDSARFPTREYGATWTPLKFYRGRSYRRHEGATYRYDAGEYSPLLGRSYAEIAAESRSQHKSQGFGALQPKGAIIGSLQREATRVNEPVPAEQERGIFDGVDTTLTRVRAGVPPRAMALVDSLDVALRRVRGAVDLRAPGRAVPQLAAAFAIADRLASEAGAAGRTSERGRDLFGYALVEHERLAAALRLATGLAVETSAARPEVARGDTVGVDVTVYNRGIAPVRVTGALIGGSHVDMPNPPGRASITIAPDSAWRWHGTARADSITAPWWLTPPRTGDLFASPASRYAENGARDPSYDVVSLETRRPLEAAAVVTLAIDGAAVNFRVPVVHRAADAVKGDVSHPLAVTPAVSITLDRTAEYAPANTALDRTVRVSLRSASAEARDVTVSLALPAGLTADSVSRTASLDPFGAARLTFRLRGRLPAGRHTIAATARSAGETFRSGYQLVDYDHIRPQRLYRDATLDVQAVDVKLPARPTIAYVSGVGDNVAPALRQLGLQLTVLEPTSLGSADLSRYGAVVVGPRAYEAHPELRANNERLLDYARAGGTLVVQYQQYEVQEPGVVPYPMTVARPNDRVTEEQAPVRILDAAAPVLTTPNRIGERDFAGWVQERSLYMPRTFDERYRPVLAMNDPGEPSNEGAILVAPYGRGTYVYTTLAFFRQLPAGNPGAARLFLNLLASDVAGDAARAARPPVAGVGRRP